MRKLLFIIICILALLIGAYPLIYFFVAHENTFLGSKSWEVLQNQIWKFAFFAHIIFGGISLFIGWRQFGSKFRNKHPQLHRIIGKSYVISVLISSVSAIYMGLYANGGMISSAGFIFLGIVWLITTLTGLIQIRKGNMIKHQQLMIYSYACTFAAVTLRLWYPLLSNITKDPVNSYIAVAWLCWLPNLMVAYIINKKNLEAN
ncbi:Predicted membrane protein (DUF2306) [Chryseobacterium nakagawai]|uniref:DUF2306 domain-containing protein n=1 Tax=Chryseobacterium nakagawai TaxID=1241982 RepID=A0AAD0YLE0_CHRNA|nr:DUF2306 domain-containing protein [Chryseobacterium nakagawai]AZA91972.1 DUF2306 domain-containing protein [Chryseobacterium nakagawai]VEH18495.1 Predicted membrane protein (DUF2306) [Chryseobacterium nakagawai]